MGELSPVFNGEVRPSGLHQLGVQRQIPLPPTVVKLHRIESGVVQQRDITSVVMHRRASTGPRSSMAMIRACTAVVIEAHFDFLAVAVRHEPWHFSSKFRPTVDEGNEGWKMGEKSRAGGGEEGKSGKRKGKSRDNEGGEKINCMATF